MTQPKPLEFTMDVYEIIDQVQESIDAGDVDHMDLARDLLNTLAKENGYCEREHDYLLDLAKDELEF